MSDEVCAREEALKHAARRKKERKMTMDKMRRLKLHSRVAWRFFSMYPLVKKITAKIGNMSAAATTAAFAGLGAATIAAAWLLAGALSGWLAVGWTPRDFLVAIGLVAIVGMIVKKPGKQEIVVNRMDWWSLMMTEIIRPGLRAVANGAQVMEWVADRCEAAGEKPEGWGQKFLGAAWLAGLAAATGFVGAVAMVSLAATVATVLFIMAAPVAACAILMGANKQEDFAAVSACWPLGAVVASWLVHAQWRRLGAAMVAAARRAGLFAARCARGWATWARGEINVQDRRGRKTAANNEGWDEKLVDWARENTAWALGLAGASMGIAMGLGVGAFVSAGGSLGLSISGWTSPAEWVKGAIYVGACALMLKRSERLSAKVAAIPTLGEQMLASLMLPMGAVGCHAENFFNRCWEIVAAGARMGSKGSEKWLAAAALMGMWLSSGALGIFFLVAGAAFLIAIVALVGIPVIGALWAFGAPMPRIDASAVIREGWGWGIVARAWWRHAPWPTWRAGVAAKFPEWGRVWGREAWGISGLAKAVASGRAAEAIGECLRKASGGPERAFGAMRRSLQDKGAYSDIERDYLGGGSGGAAKSKSRRL